MPDPDRSLAENGIGHKTRLRPSTPDRPGLAGEVAHGAALPFALMDFEREERQTLASCDTLQADAVIKAELTTLMQGRLFELDIHTGTFLSAADAHQPRARSPLFSSV